MSKSGPKYISIYDNLKVDILSGKYPAGTFLPTESELIDTYSASRTTVRRAISILVKEGFVDVRQGRGTKVLPIEKTSKPSGFSRFHNATSISGRFLMDGPKQISVQTAVIDLTSADREVAGALGIHPGDQVYRLQRIQFIDNLPFSYIIDYLVPRLVPGLEKHVARISNLQKYLTEECHINTTPLEETISAVTAGFVESRVLNISVGDPLLIFRKGYACAEGPLQYSVTTCRSDIFTLVVKGDNKDIHNYDSHTEVPENQN